MKKPKSNRRNYIVKPKVSRKLIISTVASVMAVTIALSLVWHAMKVSVPVEANTLSGVSEALKDHGSGEAFIILDIVPGTTDDELPLGTMGYLTSGQSQLEKKLKEIFKNDLDGDFVGYDAREEMAERLANYGYLDGFNYLESPFRENSSWIEFYGGNKDVDTDYFDTDEAFNGYWSIVKGHVVPAEDGSGEYKYVSEFDSPQNTMVLPLKDSSYISSNEKLYEGYSFVSAEVLNDENISDYDDDTPVYIVNNEGSYIYICTIAEFPEIMEEQDGELDELKETITNNEEEIESYKGRIAEIQKQLKDINDQLEGLIQEESTTQESDGTEGDGAGTESASLNWMKFVGVDDEAGENGGSEAIIVTEDDDEAEEGSEPGKGEGDGSEPGKEEGEGDETGKDVPPSTDDPSEELKSKQEELNSKLDELNKELEELNIELKELEELQIDLQKEVNNYSQEDYWVAEFEPKTVEEGEEPIPGLFVADKTGPVPYEKPIMMLADEGDARDSTIPDVTEGLVYVGSGNGGTHKITLDSKGEEILVFGAPIYFRCYQEDLLKRYVFEDSGLNIEIKVKSAADVNIEDVRSANLIYIEDVAGRNSVQYINAGTDMIDPVMFNIIDRAVNDLTPVIVDYSVSEGGNEGEYNGSNYQKLASILLMTDLYSFFQDMDGKLEDMKINAESDKYGRKTYTSYVNNNIYVVECGDLSTRSDFAEEFTNIGGFEEVQSAIDMERRQGKEGLSDPSKAMAVQYIINYANGFIGDFRDELLILELQPTDGLSDLNEDRNSKNNSILYWKKPGSSGAGQQILRSRKLIDNISVTTESVAQFAGEQRDINDKYQMIFIGLDGQSLNDDGKDTVYNDSDLNGKVYSGVGDIADGEGRRYDGIDITPQKMEALLDFMRAGYPIVVENNFFVEKSAKDANARINTDYIDESSHMYEFLETALSSADYRWCLYTIADIHENYSDFVAQINVHRPAVEFDWDNAVSGLNVTEEQERQIIQRIEADAEGKYRGYIPYKVMDDEGGSYNSSVNTRFYLDMDQDGRFEFDPLEVMPEDEIVISNGVLMIEFTAPESGIIPWKLEVSDENNSSRRASMTGYFRIKQSETQMPIRVVQVIGGNTEGSLDAAFNLELAYDYDDGAGQKALLGYYLKDAARITNTKLEIETMTVGQLAEELKFNAEYLSGADVLVLGFGPDCNLNVPVTDKNVEWYVNKYILEGRGVLVSSAASSEALGRMQLDASALGQKKEDIKTYNSFGRSKPSSVRYYKYSTLDADMFDDWSLLSASIVNDGAVSHYPYEVGSKVQLGNSVKISDYVLDLSSNGISDTVPDVTAWYCLGMYDLNIDTSYDVSKNDAANNYYIYSKGNVVYVGESEYRYAYDSTVTPIPPENMAGVVNCKLFVNALMEAYSVGIKNPKVTIVAGFSGDSSEIDSICIPYDEQIRDMELEVDGVSSSEGVLDDTVDVYFKISDPNFAFGKVVTFDFYYEDNINGVPLLIDEVPILVDDDGYPVNVTSFTLETEIWTVEDNQLVPVTATTGLDFDPDKIYKIKAPVRSIRNEHDSVDAGIYIVVQSHFIKFGQDIHPIGSDSVTLNRAQLFLLE